MGYKRVVLRSDGEAAIIALKQAVKANIEVDIVLENSPAYDSQANGEVGNAITQVKGMIRTMKLSLEARYGQQTKAETCCGL